MDYASADPAIADQMKPLPTVELYRPAFGCSGECASREDAVTAAAAAFKSNPRPERLLNGQPVPQQLFSALLSALHSLK